MKVRYYIDVDIPEEESKVFSEGMDVTLYGNRLVKKLLAEANSCDDLPLDYKFLD